MAKKKVLKTPIPEITDSSPTQLRGGEANSDFLVDK